VLTPEKSTVPSATEPTEPSVEETKEISPSVSCANNSEVCQAKLEGSDLQGVLPDSASSRMSESTLEDVSNSMASFAFRCDTEEDVRRSDQAADPSTALAPELSSSGQPAEDVRATESTFAEEGDADTRRCEQAVKPEVAVTEEDEILKELMSSIPDKGFCRANTVEPTSSSVSEPVEAENFAERLGGLESLGFASSAQEVVL